MDTIKKLPQHLGIIMDGNRRYAKERGEPGWRGHENGIRTFHAFIDWLEEFGVKETTFYTFSTENFNRTKKEVNELMKHFRTQLEALRQDKRIKKNNVRVRFVGRLWMFPEDIQQLMYTFMEETKTHKNYTINFAMGYGGRAELMDCIKNLVEEAASGTLKADDVTEDYVSERMYIHNDIDMIIRTGDVMRTSNFFPWQTVYCEWFFLKKMWPALTKRDFYNCLAAYGKREQRRGK